MYRSVSATTLWKLRCEAIQITLPNRSTTGRPTQMESRLERLAFTSSRGSRRRLRRQLREPPPAWETIVRIRVKADHLEDHKDIRRKTAEHELAADGFQRLRRDEDRFETGAVHVLQAAAVEEAVLLAAAIELVSRSSSPCEESVSR